MVFMASVGGIGSIGTRLLGGEKFLSVFGLLLHNVLDLCFFSLTYPPFGHQESNDAAFPRSASWRRCVAFSTYRKGQWKTDG